MSSLAVGSGGVPSKGQQPIEERKQPTSAAAGVNSKGLVVDGNGNDIPQLTPEGLTAEVAAAKTDGLSEEVKKSLRGNAEEVGSARLSNKAVLPKK